ncbi:MAG: molybdate ABC transporter permease subunit [Myxococcota bacterium]
MNLSPHRTSSRERAFTGLGALFAIALVGLLALPLLALASSVSLSSLNKGLAHPMFWPALWLSLRTTLTTLSLTILLGTPLAWWLARSDTRLAGAVEVLVELPIVVPPAVVGVALLQAFGRQGLLGLPIPFTTAAVVLAQLVVASPFYVRAGASAFAELDPDTLLVARTLGAGPNEAWARVALPMAMPGLIAGASLAWARALGEFGATLLFAGNLSGVTQTMPLAIFTALERDVELATVFALALAALGALLLVVLRAAPKLWRTRSS